MTAVQPLSVIPTAPDWHVHDGAHVGAPSPVDLHSRTIGSDGASGAVHSPRVEIAAAGATDRRDKARTRAVDEIDDDMPDPEPLVINLSRGVLEILAGVREVEQLARWMDERVYRHVLHRATNSSRERQLKGVPVVRPQFTIGIPIVTRPAHGVVEAVTVIHQRSRSRAVAIRLEAIGSRWRATAINVV